MLNTSTTFYMFCGEIVFMFNSLIDKINKFFLTKLAKNLCFPVIENKCTICKMSGLKQLLNT